MTRTDVVDASAFAAIAFFEPDADMVADRLANSRMLAPPIVVFEVANVLWAKSRRAGAERRFLTLRFIEFLELPIEVCDIDVPAAVALGLQQGLTVYDACYVWLARERNAGLVTLDRQMARVASNVGVR